MFKNSQAKKPDVYEEKKGSRGVGTHQPKKESNRQSTQGKVLDF